MKYTIVIEKLAKKFIVKLSKPEKERILRAIYKLPEGNDIKELKGRQNKGLYRLRVGDYRVIYTIDNGKDVVKISLCRSLASFLPHSIFKIPAMCNKYRAFVVVQRPSLNL